jgi:hypothetical protein
LKNDYDIRFVFDDVDFDDIQELEKLLKFYKNHITNYKKYSHKNLFIYEIKFEDLPKLPAKRFADVFQKKLNKGIYNG